MSEPFFEVHDPSFASYVLFNAPVKRLATGFDWTEGPVWFGDRNALLFSDIPNDRIVQWSETGGISTYRQPAGFTNGHTRDRQGRLISCQHGTRSVTRTEFDGSVTTLADSHDGKRLNSPNDVVVHSDGSVWFSDPHYGIGSNYEGTRAEQEQPCHVYRIDPATGAVDAKITSMQCPNGLAFSADETLLYVADTGSMFEADAPQHMRSYALGADGSLSDQGIFYKPDVGVSDGFRLDTDGNVWTSAGDGVHCVSPAGKLLGKILVPEIVSNVCFGGRNGHHLYMTGTTSLYRISLNREGLRLF